MEVIGLVFTELTGKEIVERNNSIDNKKMFNVPLPLYHVKETDTNDLILLDSDTHFRFYYGDTFENDEDRQKEKFLFVEFSMCTSLVSEDINQIGEQYVLDNLFEQITTASDVFKKLIHINEDSRYLPKDTLFSVDYVGSEDDWGLELNGIIESFKLTVL